MTEPGLFHRIVRPIALILIWAWSGVAVQAALAEPPPDAEHAATAPDNAPNNAPAPASTSEPPLAATQTPELAATQASLPTSQSGLRLKEDTGETARPLSGQSIGQMLGGLLAVLVLFVAFVWVMRQLQGKLPGQSTRIRIDASLALGAREKLVIVSVDQQRLLLGVTAQQINCLQVLGTAPVNAIVQEGSSDETANATTADPHSEFSRRLQALLHREPKDV